VPKLNSIVESGENHRLQMALYRQQGIFDFQNGINVMDYHSRWDHKV
jgi:hypothetical protein